MFKFVILLSVVACAFGAAVPEGLLPQLDGRIMRPSNWGRSPSGIAAPKAQATTDNKITNLNMLQVEYTSL